MREENAIEVKNIIKHFRIYMDKGGTLKEKTLFRKRRKYEERWVLNNVSFSVRKGEAIGLIGHNGCGKSTTLKLLTKIMYPDAGSIEMSGRVSSLIELGAGFHPDMSGRENIYINASIFGLNRKEIDDRIDQIIEFSELEEFIENPVRTYSSGMYMRLAFSVAINVDADILLIDEILAVGDAHFQEKCFDKLKEIKKSGTTIVIVSHSLGQIEEICDRSIWIDKGKIVKEGAPIEVHEEYLDFMNVKKKINSDNGELEEKKKRESELKNKFRNGKARIQNIYVKKENGERERIYSEGGKTELEFEYAVEDYIQGAEFNIEIKDHMVKCRGTEIYSLKYNNERRGGSEESSMEKQMGGSGHAEKQMELREEEWLFHNISVMNKEENLVPMMFVNGHCDRNDSTICIHNGGVMWGPDLSLPPLNYRLLVHIDYSGTSDVILNVTKEFGKVHLQQFRLVNGENTLKLNLYEGAENLEFVIRNEEYADIMINKIVLL